MSVIYGYVLRIGHILFTSLPRKCLYPQEDVFLSRSQNFFPVTLFCKLRQARSKLDRNYSGTSLELPTGVSFSQPQLYFCSGRTNGIPQFVSRCKHVESCETEAYLNITPNSFVVMLNYFGAASKRNETKTGIAGFLGARGSY